MTNISELGDSHESHVISSLTQYTILGKSGLRVSPFCLGTGGSFGDLWCPQWITNKVEARKILNYFFEAGGNFIDTADSYHESEKVIGDLLSESAIRDRMIIATKFSFGMHPNDPNGGGNGRKYIIRAIEDSLKRLKTDYIDLYWMHTWDTLTPIEEVLSTLNNLVQSGKVRYIGLSNVPAWYLGRAQTLAELRGWEKICAIQLEYSLAMRTIEFEYVTAAKELGINICSWGPLANGLLTGKYQYKNKDSTVEGRLSSSNAIDPYIDANSEKIKNLIEELITIAKKLHRTPAQVALNWVANQPSVASTIVGASNLNQLKENLHSLEFEIPTQCIHQLNELSKPGMYYPYFFHTGEFLNYVHSQTEIKRKS